MCFTRSLKYFKFMKIYRRLFAKKLQSLMRLRNISQIELADKLGVSAAAVSRWVNAHDFPEDERLVDINEALEVEEDYWIGAELGIQDPLRRLVSGMSRLNEDQISRALSLIESIASESSTSVSRSSVK